MTRTLLLATIAIAVVAIPVEAKRIARPFTPIEKTARAEVVVTGAVSAIEKEMVKAIRFPGDTEKALYRVAVIKIDKAVVGGEAITHVKVGFIPPPPVDRIAPRPPIRGGFQPVDLQVGQKGVFFLTRHPSGEFYTITPMMPPLNSKDENFKAQAAEVTQAAAALADPKKALKAEKAEERLIAARTLVMKYRTYPENGEATERVKVPADESQLILKTIAEADWKKADENGPGAVQSFYQLGLNAESGFQDPESKPGVDYRDALKAAFVAWLAGPGKDYRIEKVVPKKK
jgi:hypothetical protein